MRPLLVLASSSPRRRMLLAAAGLDFEVVVPGVAETRHPDETPSEMVERLSLDKARWVAQRVASGSRRLVLGSDTAVVLDGRVLGKPRDADEALSMLQRLGGRRHQVVTGVALVDSDGGHERVLSVESHVSMRRAHPAELRAYVASGEGLDKAGAYALQGEGRRFVERVEGSESNVIGLPVEETLALLHAAGLPLEDVAEPATDAAEP